MSDDPIKAYTKAGHVDAEHELEALGLTVAEKFFGYATKIVRGKVDHLSLSVFAEQGGIPIYMASIANAVVFFAVQDTELVGRSVTIMLALERRPCVVDGKRWDGSDLRTLKEQILEPRLKDYFA